MHDRLVRVAFLVAALAAWWFGFRALTPWVQRVAGFGDFAEPWRTLFGHWFFWQLPGVALCVVVWLVGARMGVMPSLRGALSSGGSWRRVAKTGLIATAILLALTVVIGGFVGRFGWHPPFWKMAGDLVSNLYEELVHRGLVFCAFYGVVAGRTFPLAGDVDRAGVIAAAIASCLIFAAGHGQYALPLRATLAVISVVFVAPWVLSRSLWAAWLPHTIGDVVGDSILRV